MMEKNDRRSFLKNLSLSGLGLTVVPDSIFRPVEQLQQEANGDDTPVQSAGQQRQFNGSYTGEYLKRIAFPIGGIGAGMFCLEGTGSISHMSVRHKPEVFHEPGMFAAISVKGLKNGTKIMEGPVPDWKKFGQPGSGNGLAGSINGLPRFTQVDFTARFPFATIHLKDEDLPLQVEISGWSPFIPGDEDNSSLPAGGLEYKITNKSLSFTDAVFSYSTKNFIGQGSSIGEFPQGFLISHEGTPEKPNLKSSFSIFTDQPSTQVDHCWFRGGWWDPLTMAWNTIKTAELKSNPPVKGDAPGATLFVPLHLKPGETKTIRVLMCWFVPESELRIGDDVKDDKENCDLSSGCCKSPSELGIANGNTNASKTYKPWYSGRFKDIHETATYWKDHYDELRKNSTLFRDAFYSTTLPPEVIEAVAANLTILKSPTVLRQYDGRLWCFEGCSDNNGCCHGSCTHVWNYAQALPHLFPALERSLRHTEFCESQNREGHQNFRATIPIRPGKHDFHSAADGQLGGIMKVYREWRISGDNEWMKKLYPMVKKSMDYCINTWDPGNKGIVEEPHHNTYDIEFWGPDGMCNSFYLGALKAISSMGTFLGTDVSVYNSLFQKGKKFVEEQLYDGEYFFQKIQWKGLKAPDPVRAQSFNTQYSDEARAILEKEGPKYQYGTGCLSDGVLGSWIAAMCGLDDVLDKQKTKRHLLAVYKYNLKRDLSDHANPQRPSYALGKEGGLLLCSWPKGGKLSLPFVYSDEVWTGIEYQVASHLMLMGSVREGTDIVRTCRDRYDGRIRNPFNEYECGHWYARAMSSYGLIQGLTGLRYDAVDKKLMVDSKIGDFTSFISTATGFGTVTLKKGQVSLKAFYGSIPVKDTFLAGKPVKLYT